MSDWQPEQWLALAGVVALVVSTIVTTGATLLTAHWRREDAAADRRAEDRRQADGQAATAISLARRYAEGHVVQAIRPLDMRTMAVLANPELADRIFGESEQQPGEARAELRKTQDRHPSADVRRLAREDRKKLAALAVHTRVLARSVREGDQGFPFVNEAMQARGEAEAALDASTDALHDDDEA